MYELEVVRAPAWELSKLGVTRLIIIIIIIIIIMQRNTMEKPIQKLMTEAANSPPHELLHGILLWHELQAFHGTSLPLAFRFHIMISFSVAFRCIWHVASATA